MAFIKDQKLVYDERGNITSGSAAIVDTNTAISVPATLNTP